MNDSVTHSSSPTSSIPPVRLVLVPAAQVSGKTVPEAITPISNLRFQRIQQFLTLKDLAPKTRKVYERHLKAFSQWVDKDWAMVNLNDVRLYKLYLEQEKKLKTASLALTLSTLKSFYRWQKLAGYVEISPMDALTIPKTPEAEGQNLEGFQVDALFTAVEARGQTQQRDKAILSLLFFAGLRASEVSGLNIGDYNGVEVLIREAKHNSTGRVPVNERTDRALRDYLTIRWNETQEQLCEDDPLFVSYGPKNGGQRLGYQGIYYLVKAIALEAGLSDIYPHRGRHTFASGLLENGMDAYRAMQLTRHKSVKSFKTYTKGVDYQVAKKEYFEGQGETQRKAVSLKDMLGKGRVDVPETPMIEVEVQEPEIQTVEGVTYPMPTMRQIPRQEVTVRLKLKVEDRLLSGRNKAKVKRAIEAQVFSRYRMVKPKSRGGEYELTIPFMKEDDISKAVAEILWEMDFLAELDDCFVSHEFTGVVL